MNKAVEAIIAILKDETKLYKDLLKLSDEKKQIIIDGKVDELDKIVKIEQEIIFNIGQLEKDRELEVDRFCAVNDVKREDLNIGKIAEMIGLDSKLRLDKVQNELKELLRELKKTNDINGELLKQSLEYIDFTIGVITSTQLDSTSLYEEGKQTRRIFDAKA